MLNHTYTSVNNANLVDCGKKQHISSQPSPLLKDNFLGEFRTELDKKKVLANLGIATDLVLEWKNIQGDIGQSEALIRELDARTKYISALDGLSKTLAEGIAYLETIVGGEQSAEAEQDRRLQVLESAKQALDTEISTLKTNLSSTKVNVESVQKSVAAIEQQLTNINTLITVSEADGNALKLLDGETPGLFVPDLSGQIKESNDKITVLETTVKQIPDTYVTKNELGGDGTFQFVNQSTFDSFSSNVTGRLDNVNGQITDINSELSKTVKTGEDGHVDKLYVKQLSKEVGDNNIKITDSFEMDGPNPLDVRFVRETLEDLLALPVDVCYEGMGVIVNSLSSLYILKKPTEGSLTQKYVENINNWKCPEDLVTVALTKTEYDNLLEKNPNVFYYIYEEEITRTQEPKREEYSSDEEFQVEWEKWVESLKTLSQEYMSASWGVDIETKLGKKASAEDLNVVNSNVKQLQDEISDLKGGDSGNSLVSLGKSIEAIQEATVDIETRLNQLVTTSEEGTESGRIVAIETEVNTVKTSLNDYVTKSDLQDNTQEFIFVKTSTYQEDKETFTNQLAESVATKIVDAESINTESLSLKDANIQVDADHLTINDKPIALSEDLMKVEIIDQDTYNKWEQEGTLSDKVYYYTYDGTVSLVTNTDLQRVKDDLSDLQTLVAQLQKSIAELQQIVQGSNPTE
jgi:hypothetical protein